MLPVNHTADASVAINGGMRVELTGAIDALVCEFSVADGVYEFRARGDLRVRGQKRQQTLHQRQIRSRRLQADESARGIERTGAENRRKSGGRTLCNARRFSPGRSVDAATAIPDGAKSSSRNWPTKSNCSTRRKRSLPSRNPPAWATNAITSVCSNVWSRTRKKWRCTKAISPICARKCPRCASPSGGDPPQQHCMSGLPRKKSR